MKIPSTWFPPLYAVLRHARRLITPLMRRYVGLDSRNARNASRESTRNNRDVLMEKRTTGCVVLVALALAFVPCRSSKREREKWRTDVTQRTPWNRCESGFTASEMYNEPPFFNVRRRSGSTRLVTRSSERQLLRVVFQPCPIQIGKRYRSPYEIKTYLKGEQWWI